MSEIQSDYVTSKGDDPPPPALEYLTPEQVQQINAAIEAILERSGYGKVTIIIENNHPRFISYEITNELKKPVTSA